MKIFGILLLVIGLAAAIGSIAGVGRPADDRNDVVTVGDQNRPARKEATSVLLPIIAGMTIAAGGVLVGIGMGHFADPKIVPADSPAAEKAATTRGTTP
jgi:hypothetical protein